MYGAAFLLWKGLLDDWGGVMVVRLFKKKERGMEVDTKFGWI